MTIDVEFELLRLCVTGKHEIGRRDVQEKKI